MKGIIRKLTKNDLNRIKKYTDDFLNSVEKEIEARNVNASIPFKVGDCLIQDFEEYISLAKVVSVHPKECYTYISLDIIEVWEDETIHTYNNANFTASELLSWLPFDKDKYDKISEHCHEYYTTVNALEERLYKQIKSIL